MKTAMARTSLNSTKTSAVANPPCGSVGDRTSAPTTMTSCARCTANRNRKKTYEILPLQEERQQHCLCGAFDVLRGGRLLRRACRMENRHFVVLRHALRPLG